MIEFRLDIDGLEEKLAERAEEYQARLAKGIKRAGQQVAGEARKRAPVNTGHLRRSIRARLKEENGETVSKIGTNVDYAIHVEYGHRTRGGKSYVLGRYFLYGALQSQKGNVLRIITRALNRR